MFHPLFRILFATGAFAALLSDGFGGVRTAAVEVSTKPQEAQTAQQTPDLRNGRLLKITLPIDAQSASQTKLALKRIAEKAVPSVRSEDRFVVILEFETETGKTGRGSELEACQSLARFLVSSEMNHVETVAYIPAGNDNDETTGKLSGHAVLVAIAANQIAMDSTASIGDAGIDEENVDSLVREVYRGLASKRLTLPVPVVMAMLESSRQLFRVRTGDGIVYADGDKLDELERQGTAIETTTLNDRGVLARLSSKQLEDFRLIRNRVADQDELASRLKLTPHSLDQTPVDGDAWRAVEVRLPPFIDQRTSQWVMRALGSELNSKDAPNLVIVRLEGNTGDVDACLNLARFLVDLDSNAVQTVAYVEQTVRGPVAMLALCCDQLLLHSNSRLGGASDNTDSTLPPPGDLEDLQPIVQGLARDSNQNWSLLLAMLDPQQVVNRYRNHQTGQLRLLTEAELNTLDAADEWQKQGPIDTENGLTAEKAEQYTVARTIVDDLDQLMAFYQLEQEPPVLQPSATDQYIERVASFLARPGISMLLLFAAMMFMSTEMSAPGLGVPGFVSAMCFLAFFWSQYLGGNADWLEIMLFIAGVAFIGIEIFLVPGIGIFGVGGVLMVGVSLILASQSFLFPQSSEQWSSLPNSLMPVLGAGLGLLAAAFALRNVLPNSPYFRRLMLDPNSREPSDGPEGTIDREAIVDFSFLTGQSGEAITPLVPAGKARISGKVYDVITDGRMVEKGQRLHVKEAIGNRVVVIPEKEVGS